MHDEEPTPLAPSDTTLSPEDRLADLRRRRAEAVDVLAETLLDIWLNDRRRARREAGKRGEDV